MRIDSAAPNTDVAVMLAMCHTLLVEGLHDQSFLDRYTTGFDRFAAYLRGENDGTPKTAAWAAGISGIAAKEIVTLSRMAAERTMLTVSWSPTRSSWRAALLGRGGSGGDDRRYGQAGWRVSFGYTITNYLGNNVFKMPCAASPGRNAVVISFLLGSATCLARASPSTMTASNMSIPTLILSIGPAAIRFTIIRIPRMRLAWQKPSTVIVNEWWNAVARHADIVLPCTTTLERSDIGMTPRDPYVN